MTMTRQANGLYHVTIKGTIYWIALSSMGWHYGSYDDDFAGEGYFNTRKDALGDLVQALGTLDAAG